MAITSTLLVACLFFVPIVAGLIGLQIFLSRRQTWWPGILLPAVSFILSCLSVVGTLLYVRNDSNTMIIGSELGFYCMIFLIENIPTALFLVIYEICRKKYRRKNEIEKMNIQDL